MGWIITGLANVFLEIVNDLICWIMKVSFNLDIAIGYDPDQEPGQMVDYVYLSSKNVKGLFDQVFPYAASFIPAFLFLGYGMVIIIAVYKLYETMLSSNGEAPSRIVGGIVFGFMGVTCSYSFFIYFEQIANVFFEAFKDVVNDVNDETGMGDLNNIFDMVSLINNDELIKDQGDIGFSNKVTIVLLVLVLFLALFFQLIRLAAEVFERYVVLGLMFYTSPLAFAMLTSKGTTDIFRKWIQMVASQFILLMMNLFFLSVFSGAMGNIFITLEEEGYAFSSDVDFITKMLLLIGWLTVGQKVDEHLRSLGLSASQSGHALGAALLAGTITARSMISSGTRLAKTAGKGVAKGASALGKAAGTTAAGAAFMDKFGAGPAAVVSQAERKNGKLTQEGAKAIMGTEGAKVKGTDAKDGMQALGIDPDSKKFNTAKGQDGKLHNKHADADWNQSSMGDGRATIRDGQGNVLSEFGLSNQYSVPDDAAAKSLETEAGMMTYAATSDVISADQGKILDSLSASPEYGASAGVVWTAQDDGTLTGVDAQGLKWQAAADYVASVDASAGPTRSGAIDDVSYTVQQLSRNENAGFASIRPAASSPSLVPKTSQERKAAQRASTNANRFKKRKDKM